MVNDEIASHEIANPAGARCETLLVVDDNTENLILLELLLSSEDFTVRTAGSAKDALKALEADLPDAMLTDIQMPDVDGLELIRTVRMNAKTKELYIVAVSANAMKEDIEEAYQAGCDDYITKPVDTHTFAASVREQLKAGRNGKTKHAPGSGVPQEEKFLADCSRQLEQLISDKNAPLWREQAGGILHQCAGTAGALGYPQIAGPARDLEARSAALNNQEFAEGLIELADLLADINLQTGTRSK
jgi:CheY-like chemotaxis protein